MKYLIDLLALHVFLAIAAIGVRAADAPRNPDQGTAESWVEKVDVPEAALGGTVQLTVEFLDKWIRKQPKGNGGGRSEWDLVPFLNGMALAGIHPEMINISAPIDGRDFIETQLRFKLRRTPDCKDAWASLLNRPALRRPVEVSVGFADSNSPMVTKVSKEDFCLVIISKLYLIIGALVIVSALVACLYMARRTNLLRDVGAPPRPDGLAPFSLARCQMAFWFFLVIASYFLLWMILGDKDTITESVLGLIGISAATALGSAFLDAGKRGDAAAPCMVRRIAEPGERAAEIRSLKDRLEKLDAAIAAREQAIAAGGAGANVADLQKQQEADRASRDLLDERLRYFLMSPAARVMRDLLSDAGSISFHRFQIAVWTIVLGIIFCTDVYNQLAMPQFSGTLLGLMGISSGTYLGFKVPKGTM